MIIKASKLSTGRIMKKIKQHRIMIKNLLLLILLLLAFSVSHAQAEWAQVTTSEDGTSISYEVYGNTDPTLVFVHGWSCDTRYWRNQVSYFSKDHKIVLIDLAGHGHSGMNRETYSMKAFGEDVKAVIEATGARQFVQSMLLPGQNAQLNDWIAADMSAAPPAVALSAINEYMSGYITGDAAKIFDNIKIPVMVVSADMWPIDYEANRRHMSSFDAIVLKASDHFLMMNRPEDFNSALKRAIDTLVEK